jgi:hypothetical protein
MNTLLPAHYGSGRFIRFRKQKLTKIYKTENSIL